MSHRTAAIVVTYEPAPEALQQLVAALDNQVRLIVIVDNASSNTASWSAALPPQRTRLIRLSSNEGIASAINHGFVALDEQPDIEFCILFDQDSQPSADMIGKLENHHDRLSRRGPVAQVGPYFFEHNRGYFLPFIEFKWGYPRRKRDPGNGISTTADYLISSGALISLKAVRIIGHMDDTLFIDYVDIEWGLRARSAGWQSYGAFDVRMEHRIGEDALEIAGVRLAVHKPLRRYYYYRNALLLCRRPYIPVAWKINEVVRLTLKFFIFSLLSKRRAEDRAMMIAGIRDGLAGKAGKFSGGTQR